MLKHWQAVKASAGILKETISSWNVDRVPSLSAALAYYIVLSIAPLLVVAIAVAGLLLGTPAAQNAVVQRASSLLGDKFSHGVRTMLESAHRPGIATLAGILGVITLLVGAGAVFVELQGALDVIWRVHGKPSGFRQTIKGRFASCVMVLGVGVLLLLSLLASAAVAVAGRFLQRVLPYSETILHLLNSVFFFVILTVLFAVLFKLLPHARVAWRDVWVGAVFTSALFCVGELAVGWYLEFTSIGSEYGAAGSVVLLLAWIYYSAQIFYFGAEFTRVQASKRDPAAGYVKEFRNGGVRGGASRMYQTGRAAWRSGKRKRFPPWA